MRWPKKNSTHCPGWVDHYKDPGDGSGDVIIELPSELLERLGWSLGDELSVEAGEENICLKLKQRADGASS
ncbi:AbrB/MazE/SpoVT family DNA-binding domain-containing protein [Pseudomonas aeruginosa]|uniref:AbrB/MazE/SpoVT family DNA-binding domain-containing protein n=2 Tax=Pseudomonas aeruginosa TaxID=287 RepID=UPI0039655FAF